MTKKDYIALSSAINASILDSDLYSRRSVVLLIDALIVVLQKDNARFCADRFLAACTRGLTGGAR